MWTLFAICFVIAIIEFMLIIDLKPRPEIPLYAFLIALFILFIPVINIAGVLALGTMLAIWCQNDGSLMGTNPVSKFFKLLNKNI